MKEIKFEQLQETLFYEKLDNGLEVFLLPKSSYNKTYATFTTKYGSIDNQFIPLGQEEYTTVPDGIAHFLEHKMFEKEDGDVFQHFSKQGASANAFTSFTRTAYLFSSTSNVDKNLKTLLDFVQAPYFTEQTVEKEKGIIGQEITMYDDNPDWRLYFGIIQNMFHHHPVKIDIAGTIDSISKITKDDLYTCYHTFYHPSNMLLFVVGPIDVHETMDLIKSNQDQKEFAAPEEISRRFEDEPDTVAEAQKVLKMNVKSSKCLVGFKAKNVNRDGRAHLKHELCTNVVLDALFGKSSVNYEKLYNEGLIDDTFSYEYSKEQGFGFAVVGGDTKDPDKLSSTLKQMFMEAKQNGLSSELLEKVKRKKIGSFLRSLNSPEFIANQFTRYAFNDMEFFEIVPMLEQISMNDVAEAVNELIDEQRFTECRVVPKHA